VQPQHHHHQCANPTPIPPPARRLKSLPADVLPTIAGKAGRPARRACRLLGDAYGPLDCGLRVDGPIGAYELLGMVALNTRRFDHITSLVLTAPKSTEEGEEVCACPEGLLPALCTALPTLTALTTPHSLSNADVAGLAPLARHLTALKLPTGNYDYSCGVASLLALTGLRSLAIPLHSWAAGPEERQLQALSGLCQLRALEWLSEDLFSGDAATWFVPLRVLSGLTSLLIRPAIGTWDQAALETLREAFPRLSALALLVESDGTEAPADGAVLAALAGRTALTSLQLCIENFDGRTPDLWCMSALQQLADLSVVVTPCRGMEQVVDVAMGMGLLTSLHLQGYHPNNVTSEHLALLARHLKNLSFSHSRFSAGAFALHMACLTLVTSLKLARVSLGLNPFVEDELGQGRLSNLEVLEITSDEMGSSGASQRHMLKHLAGMSRLRDLTLTASKPDGTLRRADEVLQDVHLWQLLPLCHTLTRLVLGGVSSTEVLAHIVGPGLGVVGRLTRLRELTLCNMAVLESHCLHDYLLPLPASLRRLEVGTGCIRK
jgi:hypothetical protein